MVSRFFIAYCQNGLEPCEGFLRFKKADVSEPKKNNRIDAVVFYLFDVESKFYFFFTQTILFKQIRSARMRPYTRIFVINSYICKILF